MRTFKSRSNPCPTLSQSLHHFFFAFSHLATIHLIPATLTNIPAPIALSTCIPLPTKSPRMPRCSAHPAHAMPKPPNTLLPVPRATPCAVECRAWIGYANWAFR